LNRALDRKYTITEECSWSISLTLHRDDNKSENSYEVQVYGIFSV